MRRFIILGCTLSATMTSAATTADAAVGEPQGTVVTYARTGGFAGFNDTITVDVTGVAHVSSTPTEILLSAPELDGLRADLGRIRTWWSSPAGCDIADHIAYSLTYGDRRARRCQVVPRDWQPAISRLDGLLARARSARSAPV